MELSISLSVFFYFQWSLLTRVVSFCLQFFTTTKPTIGNFEVTLSVWTVNDLNKTTTLTLHKTTRIRADRAAGGYVLVLKYSKLSRRNLHNFLETLVKLPSEVVPPETSVVKTFCFCSYLCFFQEEKLKDDGSTRLSSSFITTHVLERNAA